MAYSELIKSFSGIRRYMREFLVYGFKKRDDFDRKSARSYDNEKRRVESWLADYMTFRQDASGKSVFLSVDSRHIPRNPLFKAWKASSFTKNDINLHFFLLDILTDGKPRTVLEIMEKMDADYFSNALSVKPFDESTLRKKLKEYVELGLITAEKQGKQLIYALAENDVHLETWAEAIAFFAEDNPLGVVGSYLLDKVDVSAPFIFKHRYLLFALDSGIMLDLLAAIHAHTQIEMELYGAGRGKPRRQVTLPLKIFISVQGGRQYLAAYNSSQKKISFFRLDSIQAVRQLEPAAEFDAHQVFLANEASKIWGVSIGQGKIEHIEMTLTVTPTDLHIVHRLEREKRCGAVHKLDDTTWRFSADVYDAWELAPWLRTFIGRIGSLTCSNAQVEKQFWADYTALEKLYGGDADVV